MALQGLLNRGELDGAIAVGVDGFESPELARRLAQEPGGFGSELRAAITKLTPGTPGSRYHRNAAPSRLES
jgi:hypothetical protein